MVDSNDPSFVLEVVSDTICPWCYVGKRHLDAALAEIGDDVPLAIRWRPFQLNPDMPREGMDRRTYRAQKFGSWERSQALDAKVTAAGDAAGIVFHHDRMTRTPNTLASHVLVRLAGEQGVQDAVIEALFQAYFTDGRDVGDGAVLAEIGAACGLDRDAVDAALADDGLRAAVQEEARAFAQAGVTGVPTLLLNRFVLATGAASPETIANAVRAAAADGRVIAAGREARVDA